MRRKALGMTVFEASLERLMSLYADGHRLVVSFSGGKDSTCVLNMAILAARATGRLPVEVMLRDEEIIFPGTYEYAERVAQRPEVDFNWVYANQPVINVFNRAAPYFWVFDPELPASSWVREPPPYAYHIDSLDITSMTIPRRFPPDEGKDLLAVIGLRTQESMARTYGLFSSGGHVTKPNQHGVRSVRPIYDWKDGDVWRAISENQWDYNRAYDTMHRMGVRQTALRIGPPTMNAMAADLLVMASKAWPTWFERVAARLPGIRSAAKFGKRVLQPSRRLGETWEDCFKRECLTEAPEWIQGRSRVYMERMLSTHRHHSTSPFPEVKPCYHCAANNGSWRALARNLYNGDPFAQKCSGLPYVQPEYFREGAGRWEGSPAF
jgi:predicted phosphoadenosine phosphosulfate sulfurtransferase